MKCTRCEESFPDDELVILLDWKLCEVCIDDL
jgi:formylmethanofuran dehydrogenase subunit E